MCVGSLPRVIEVDSGWTINHPIPSSSILFGYCMKEKERREVGRVALQCEKP